MSKLKRIVEHEVRKVLKENSRAQADKLAKLMQKNIVQIDESLSAETLAQAVAMVLADHYGDHNLKDFILELKTFYSYYSA